MSVIFTYLIADQVSKHDQAASLLATALMAFNPMFLFISASVNNDNLIVPLSTVTLWLLLLILEQGLTLRRTMVLGLLCGLAALTKLSGLALVGLSGAVVFVAAVKKGKKQWLWGGAAAIGIGVAAIAGWWYLRNWRLYGDPLGIDTMLQIAGRRPAPVTWRTLLAEFQGFRISYWGLFGGVNVLAQQWIYWLADALAIGAFIGWIALLLQSGRPRPAVGYACLLALWPVMVMVSLIRWTMSTYASQGRLLFPAGAAVAALMAIGLLWWARGRRRRLLAALWGTLMFVAAATSPLLAIAPAYAQKPVMDEHELPSDLIPLYVDYEGKMQLLGYQVHSRTVREGDQLWVTAYWKALAPMSKDYSVFVHLFDHDRQQLGALDTYPGLGTRPTSLLQPGQIVADYYGIEISESVSKPSACAVEIGLYDLQTMQALPATDPQGQEVGRVVLSGAKLVPSPWPMYQPSLRTQFNFGDKVTLAGLDLQSERVLPDHDVQLTLYWQVDAPLAEDFTIFVHLLDPGGQLLAQADGPPAFGSYPTSLWDTGEVIADTRILHVPANIPANECLIRVGHGHEKGSNGKRCNATDVYFLSPVYVRYFP